MTTCSCIECVGDMPEPTNKEIFEGFISRCEETCRHDMGSSEERSVLEYLEENYGIQSHRYVWSQK